MGTALRNDEREKVSRVHRPRVSRDSGLFIRQGRALVFPRQHLLPKAGGEWQKDFLEPRQRLGFGRAGAPVAGDAAGTSEQKVLPTAVQGNGCQDSRSPARGWFMAFQFAGSG